MTDFELKTFDKHPLPWGYKENGPYSTLVNCKGEEILEFLDHELAKVIVQRVNEADSLRLEVDSLHEAVNMVLDAGTSEEGEEKSDSTIVNLIDWNMLNNLA